MEGGKKDPYTIMEIDLTRIVHLQTINFFMSNLPTNTVWSFSHKDQQKNKFVQEKKSKSSKGQLPTHKLLTDTSGSGPQTKITVQN